MLNKWIFAIICILLESAENEGVSDITVIERVRWNRKMGYTFEGWGKGNKEWIETGREVKPPLEGYPD